MLVDNALARYFDNVRLALRQLLGERDGADGDFTPGIDLPDLTPAMLEYLSVSGIEHVRLPSYRGKNLALLDLTRNPATMTTKTFASLVIVARAVRFIRDTGERVTIVTPSSGNKAIALRDAVLRAISCGLVSADQLNVVAVVPANSVPKLRVSELFSDPELRKRNPIAVYHGDPPGRVKDISRGLVDEHRTELERGLKTNFWYTLRLENYLAADIVRAFAEAEFFPASPDEPRLHAHAVSSAYGLLGHSYGRSMAPPESGGGASPDPRYFLVQHLGAPDMVLSLYHQGSTDPSHLPQYTYDLESGLYGQDENPRFPAVTFEPSEALDPTFYTRGPATSPRMDEIIHEQGGGGIVVSMAECLNRYPRIRALLGAANIRLPAQPVALREWSLVMAFTGVLNAIDRGLIAENDVLVHGSGSYSVADYAPLTDRDLHPVEDVESLRQVLCETLAS
ncbi:hypothetical protein GCM10022254_62470 [Actinomadura meridiana]|uniref:Uncharacterized protein n=1 Tax=Actinomadura meridiana TaxID=559626 RepID=A0ABP8CIY1_9ACTN